MFKYLLLTVAVIAVAMYQAKAFTVSPLSQVMAQLHRPLSMSLLTPMERAVSSPRRTIFDLFDELDRYPMTLPSSRSASMHMDVKESDTKYDLMFDLPGVAKEDISITTEKDQLMISADRKAVEKEEGESFKRIERYTGLLTRTLTLPENADLEKITATSVNGVLTITVPKVHIEEELPKKIEIR
mmetsp:Transcript_26622/g.44488  ORF Transcript_26622/g.44488 Transcript_26622/m.44488 type:complete len:185 (-) Transcript_26622:112-666(-)